MKKFTVLGYYEESFQTFAHHVEAQNASQAFFKVANIKVFLRRRRQ